MKLHREILFRGKSFETGEWVVGSLINRHITQIVRLIDDIIEVDPKTVCQFIGQADKNGVKIFEGDILKTETNYFGFYRERITEIKFNYCIGNDSFGEPATAGYCIHGTNWEVIGNIYDNPELISS